MFIRIIGSLAFCFILFGLVLVSGLSWPHRMKGKGESVLSSSISWKRLYKIGCYFFFLPFKKKLSLKPWGSTIFSSGRIVSTTYIYLADLFNLFNTFWWSACSPVNFDSLYLSKSDPFYLRCQTLECNIVCSTALLSFSCMWGFSFVPLCSIGCMGLLCFFWSI